jgi:anti-anti-sigma factor
MNIKVTSEEGVTTYFLNGTIDIPSAENLKKSLNEIIEDQDLKELILDFNEVESIGSSGIGALLLTHKEFTSRGVKFSILNVNKEITALFKIIKLHKLFNLTD